MRFQTLQSRLIAHVKERVRSGELTERGLARLTGVSQPHIHNVLKGARALSPETADQILDRLEISLLDLLAPAELGERTVTGKLRYSKIPLLGGRIGPGYPMPALESAHERCPFLSAQVEGLENPVAARLAADVEMLDLFGAGDLVLLDRSASRRLRTEPDRYYVLEKAGVGLVRRVRRSPSGMEILSNVPGAATDTIRLLNRNILEVVRGQVVWIGRRLEPPPNCRKQD